MKDFTWESVTRYKTPIGFIEHPISTVFITLFNSLILSCLPPLSRLATSSCAVYRDLQSNSRLLASVNVLLLSPEISHPNTLHTPL